MRDVYVVVRVAVPDTLNLSDDEVASLTNKVIRLGKYVASTQLSTLGPEDDAAVLELVFAMAKVHRPT